MSSEQLVLSPRPAVRAFALAALLALAGALVVVGDAVWGWGAVALVIAVVLVLAGAGLAVLALMAGRRQRVTITLDDEGFSVGSAEAAEHGGRWSDVTRVTGAPGRLTLHEGDEKRTHLIVPSGSSADLDALGLAIGRRLDANRGYRTYEG